MAGDSLRAADASLADAALAEEGWWPAALVGAFAGCFTCWTALTGPHWFDTPEFTAVGVSLSTSHPPGHPLHALWMRAGTLAPFGDAGLRGNLTSAVAFAAALALFYRLLRACAPRAGRVPAACLALTPLFVPMLWFQAVRAEVYALQFACSVIVAGLCIRAARGVDLRAAPLLVFALGVAGTCHTFIAALWLPIALWALSVGAYRWIATHPGRALAGVLRATLLSVGAGMASLLGYAYLLLRALGGRDVGWGTPDSARELWRTVSAEQWQHVAAAERAPVGATQNARNAVDYAITQLGVPASALLFLLFALGLLGLVRGRSGTALAALAVALMAFGSRVIEPLNPDLGGYLMHGFAALLLLAWLAADAITDVLGRRGAPWAFTAVLALCALQIERETAESTRIPERIGRAMLAEVPIGGTLITSEYWTTFMQWYLQAAEGLRPDVARVFRAQVGTDWAARRLASAHPRIAERLPAFPRSFDRSDTRIEPGVELERLGRMAARLRPVGLTFSPQGASWPSVRVLERIDERILRDEAPAADSRRMLAYFRAQHAVWLLSPRKPAPEARALAASDLRLAQRLAPRDPLLAELGRRLAQLGGP